MICKSEMDELALTITCPGRPCRAFVSFLTGDGDYVKGAVALAKSLRAVKSAYPLIVAVTENVPGAHRRLLLREGCIVREVARVAPPGRKCGYEFAREYYTVNFSKLRIWQVGGAPSTSLVTSLANRLKPNSLSSCTMAKQLSSLRFQRSVWLRSRKLFHEE